MRAMCVRTGQSSSGRASVLSGTVTSSTCGVASSSQTIRVNAGVSLVGKVGVVRTRGVGSSVSSVQASS
jgi:hypothetical protein